MSEKKLNWWDYIQFITPIMIAVFVFVVGDLRNQISDLRVTTKDMSTQIVTHLCNNGIHIPRETIVSKDEFLLYQMMRDKQMNEIDRKLERILVGK